MHLLIDLAGVYFRAFHAIPESVTGPHGRPVNAIRGTLDILARLIADTSPRTVTACRDVDWRPAWRVRLVDSYKTHRVVVAGDDGGNRASEIESIPGSLGEQVPVILEMLGALGIGLAGAQGAEADDVIGTLAAAATGPTQVVTGDRDLFQIVSSTVTVRYIGAGMSKATVFDPEKVHMRFGVHPPQYADYATLRGDASDGLPGVKGIGEKTAAALLMEYGNLDSVLAAAQAADEHIRPAIRTALIAASDYVHRARQVVGIRTDCAVQIDGTGQLAQLPTDSNRWCHLVSENGLAGSAQRLLAAVARTR